MASFISTSAVRHFASGSGFAKAGGLLAAASVGAATTSLFFDTSLSLVDCEAATTTAPDASSTAKSTLDKASLRKRVS